MCCSQSLLVQHMGHRSHRVYTQRTYGVGGMGALPGPILLSPGAEALEVGSPGKRGRLVCREVSTPVSLGRMRQDWGHQISFTPNQILLTCSSDTP
jgi:hypothetical protein